MEATGFVAKVSIKEKNKLRMIPRILARTMERISTIYKLKTQRRSQWGGIKGLALDGFSHMGAGCRESREG